MPNPIKRDNVLQLDAGIGNTIQFTKLDNGMIYVEIENEWAGSTETGFGATTHITLDQGDVAHFLEWLQMESLPAGQERR